MTKYTKYLPSNNDLGKGPEARNSMDTKNYNWRDVSYKQLLLTLALLPLTYDRELRDLVFLYNCTFGYTDLKPLLHVETFS